MVDSIRPPESYPDLLAALKARIRDARLRTAVRVNRELILLYWDTASTTSCCGSPRKAGEPASSSTGWPGTCAGIFRT